MGLTQTGLKAVRGALSVLALSVGVVSVYYWLLYWTSTPSVYAMSRAQGWTLLLVLCLVPVMLIERRYSEA